MFSDKPSNPVPQADAVKHRSFYRQFAGRGWAPRYAAARDRRC